MDGQSDLFLVGARSRRPRRLTTEPSDERNAVFSRDGRRLYFASNRTGDWDLWSLELSGGEVSRVTTDGGFLAQEDWDGSRLFYTRLGQPGIWSMPLAGGEAEQQVADLDPSDWGSWVVGERGIHYLRRGPTAIAFAGFDGSPPRVSFEPDKQVPFFSRALSLSPDGRALLFTRIASGDDEVMLADLAEV